MKIVFMGTPDFAVPVLKVLVENHDVTAVITQPDRPKGRGNKMSASPVKELAVSLGIDVFQPQKIKNKESVEALKGYEADVFVVVAYGQILSEEILNMPKFGCINVHASLLPKYRGAAPMEWALINGETTIGLTIMQMDKGLDTGAMLLKKQFDVTDEDDINLVYEKMMELSPGAIIEALDGIKNGSIVPEHQDNNLSTYAPMLNTETGVINWRDSSKNIVNLVRGLCRLKLAHTKLDGAIFKILKAEKIPDYEGINAKCGVVIDIIGKKGIVVKSGDGGVLITKVQAQGKGAMAVPDYLRGNKLCLGDMFAEN
ncbi:MAG: methionyl-tRNA formyltransferase [Defluviitaleaceae bacterium]|nr:methionyl-tRNA formyltransferase [Defluviitaleaceae bacterium]